MMTNRGQLTSETRRVGKLAVLLSLWCLPLGSIKAQASRFFGTGFFATNTDIITQVVADFNNDGIPDVATCNGYSPGEANILLGNGDGTFGQAQSYDAGEGPADIAAADFDGDGNLDIVVADHGNDFDIPLYGGTVVSVQYGNGDGTFRNWSEFKAGSFPNSVAVGDFNHDGHPDIVVANDKSNIGTVSVLINRGDGTFANPVAYATALDATEVVTGDFNGDDNIDLAVGATGNAVYVLLGNGDGTFQAYQSFATSDPADLIAVADFNGDSKLDLVTGARYAQARFSMLLGNGDGTFQAPIDTATFLSPMDLAAGDVDGDGITDMAIVQSATIINIFKGNGDGTFKTPPVSYGVGYTVRMADLDGDGTLDLVSASELAGAPGIAVIPGNGDGTFQARTELPGSSVSSVTGELNGDGKPDIVDTDHVVVSVLLNAGGGNFPIRTDYPTGNYPEGVALGDVNQDGKVDIVVTNRNGNSISVLLGNGDGTFQPHHDFATASTPSGILLSDFNGDGNTDVATANQTNPGTVSILLGAGDGTFATHKELSAGNLPQSIAKSDFNGDGKTDLVVNYNYNFTSDFNSGASVFLGNGDGTFQPRVDYFTDLYDSHYVAAADLNRDGKADFIVSNYGTFSVFLGNGDGTFQTNVDYPGGFSRPVLIADINGDGNLDVVTGRTGVFVDFGALTLVLGNGDGTFQPYSQYLASPPTAISAADLNGDGALDLVVSHLYGPSISLFFNLGGSRVSLISSENPSHAGDPVTFTAKVTPTVGPAVPSGTVRFFDGDIPLGSALLNGNTATLTRSTRKVGQHKIKANYLGDSTFVPTRSKTLTQNVRP
jgi:Bacterial Ig-like domain (group 3)/FG-GAP-like repeat/FG-GAP repeat